MPRITVKPADSPAELELACQIWARANRARPRPAGAVRSARVRAKVYAGHLVLIAWYGERPAGMVVAEPFDDRTTTSAVPDTGHVAMIHVDPAVWGSGVGTTLLKALQDGPWASLSLWVRDDNRRACRLLQTTGFLDTGNLSQLQDGDTIRQMRWSRQP